MYLHSMYIVCKYIFEYYVNVLCSCKFVLTVYSVQNIYILCRKLVLFYPMVKIVLFLKETWQLSVKIPCKYIKGSHTIALRSLSNYKWVRGFFSQFLYHLNNKSFQGESYCVNWSSTDNIHGKYMSSFYQTVSKPTVASNLDWIL